MKYLKVIALIAIILMHTDANSADKVKLPKFGKFDKEILKQSVCPIDSNAHAYYIFNIGEDYLEYMDGVGFQLFSERHYMIKILDENAFNLADISIPLYNSSSKKETVSKIKAITYNIENGKVVKSEIKNRDIMLDKTSDNWSQKKFNMPDVKEGSVIEVSYKIASPFYFNLSEWKVQKTIPVAFSYYNAAIPEYFYYHTQQKGYLSINFEKSYENGTIGELLFTENNYTISKKNVPAFKKESFLRTPENYMSGIKFELSHIIWPDMTRENFSPSWDKACEKLNDSENVGYRLKQDNFLKDDAEMLLSSCTDKMELLQATLKHVQKRMTFDSKRSIYAGNSLRSCYSKAKGNAAEINYTLVVLLRKLGFEADPVLISTTDNGMIMKSTPSISNFNFVVAGVNLEGKMHYLDATDDYSEVDLLPYNCLNYEGAILGKYNLNWVNMLPTRKHNSTKAYILSLKEDGTLEGTIKFKDNDYAAYSRRRAVKKTSSTDDYMKKLEEKYEGLKVKSHSFENLDSSYCPTVCNMDVEISNATQQAGDLLLFNPLVFHSYSENPFTLEDRNYPVEFSTPKKETVSMQVTIPEGYVVEETPKPIRIALADKSASYVYSASIMGNTLIISTQLVRTKCQYLPEYYPQLKELYKEIVAKENASIVLKRVPEVAANK